MAGPPPPPTPPRDEKPTQPSPPVQEEFSPSEQTNSLPRKPQAPAVPEDDGFTRWEYKQSATHGWRNLKTPETITSHFGLVFEENTVREITLLILRWRHFFQQLKAPFSKYFPLQAKNEKPALLNFSSLRSRFRKARLNTGLVWIVGLTVEKMLA